MPLSGRQRTPRLSAPIAAEIDRAVLCWLATVNGEGMPNVSPKEIFTPYGDDRILIADIASATSARNIMINPQVCVSLVDIFCQRGRKIEGEAGLISPEEDGFDALCEPLTALTAGAFPIRHIITVRIQRITPIVAPSYIFFPEYGEDSLRAAAYERYGVRPVAAKNTQAG